MYPTVQHIPQKHLQGVFLFNPIVRAFKLDGNGLKLEEVGPNFSRFNDIPEKKSITPMVLFNDIGFISFS